MKIKYSICKYELKHWHAESEMDPPDLNSRETMTWRQNTNTCHGRKNKREMRSVMRTSVILLALQVSEYLQDNGKTEKSQAGQSWSFNKVFALFCIVCNLICCV